MRPFNHKLFPGMGRRGKWCLLLAVVLGALALLIVLPRMLKPAVPPQPLELVFAGITNNGGVRFAVFTATNPYRRDLVVVVAEPQERVGNKWSQDITFKPRTAGIALRAKESVSFYAPMPMNENPWRVPVLWHAKPTKGRAVREIFQQNARSIIENGRLLGWHIGYGITADQTNYTPPMHASELTNYVKRAATPN